MKIKIFIPSYGRANTISTHLLLEGLPWQVVVHDESEFNAYKKRVSKYQLVISDRDLGIAKQRNWIIDHLIADDEWFCFMDDNIKKFERVHPNLYLNETLPTHSLDSQLWRKNFTLPTSPDILMRILEETVKKADKDGAYFAGFATTDNPFFRKDKWRNSGFVCTKISLVRKNGLRFDERFYAKDDVDYSAQNLSKWGCVLVNNYLYPRASHHQTGGIGNKRIRSAYSAREAALLVQKWPGVCSLSKNRQSEVVFKHGRELKHDTHSSLGTNDR